MWGFQVVLDILFCLALTGAFAWIAGLRRDIEQLKQGRQIWPALGKYRGVGDQPAARPKQGGSDA